MKFVLLLVVFGLVLCSALPSQQSTYGLKEDFDRFLALVPKDQIVTIASDYLANDAEVQDAMKYIQSKEFGHLILDIENIEEYRQFLVYLQYQGLNIYYYLQKLHELLGLPNFVPTNLMHLHGKGVRGMLDDIEAILPVDDIKDLYYETLKNSEAFANLVDVLKGDAFKGLVERLREKPEFQNAVQRAKDHGVDVAWVVEILNKIFGWNIGN